MLTLNSQQEKSVIHTKGNSLVIAGAGSGKTRTLIAKIVYLIKNQNISPHNILAITFTNKATKEMQERIKHFTQIAHTPIGSQGLQIRTFHSFGAMFLRLFIEEFSKNKNTLSYHKNFSIIDPDDQKRILRQLYPEYSFTEFPFRRYLHLITTWKNLFLYPEDDNFEEKTREYFDSYGFPEDPSPYSLYHRYMDYLKSHNLLDFDDLIGLTMKLLQKYSQVADYAASRWQYILVDEYQDTNFVQEKIIEFFISRGSLVTVVGDDQQSIYSFRGAQVDNILSFKKKYPRVEVFVLEENYRSTQSILNLANHIIAKNPIVFEKKLFTQNTNGDLPVYRRFPEDSEESLWIIEKILELKKIENIPFNEIAIFYRTNYQSRAIESILVRYQLPYQVVRGHKFYERKEIKDVLSYLQWLINPQDQVSFFRMVNTPSRRLGEKTLKKIFDFLKKKNIPLSEIFDRKEIFDFIPNGVTQVAFMELQNLFQEIRKKLLTGTSPQKVLTYLIQESGLQKLYENESDKMVRDQRLGNLDALFEALDTFVKETNGGLEDFIFSISLGENEEKNQTNTIKLMTTHNTKGLEFQAVFLVGLEEGVFPHNLTLENEKEIEEERRLFYVAVTRARKKLFLSSVASKNGYRYKENFKESRFISEIEEKYIDKKNDFSSSHKYFS